MKPRRVTTGTPWERQVGYARAVRARDAIAVSGTVAADPDGRPTAADAYGQARDALRLIDAALRRLGSELAFVLRLRIHYSDPAVGEGVARALREAFPDGIPAVTGVRVAALVDPAFLVEIEADAVAPAPDREYARTTPPWDEPAD